MTVQRSNYSEPSAAVGAEEDEENSSGRAGKGRARQAISDRRAAEAGKRKKSTMNVRTAVLYKKSFAVLLEESVSSPLCARSNADVLRVAQGVAAYPTSIPTYLTAGAPPPRESPRMLCSVCGCLGKYRCRKCAMAYCDKVCEDVHEETRCERRVI